MKNHLNNSGNRFPHKEHQNRGNSIYGPLRTSKSLSLFNRYLQFGTRISGCGNIRRLNNRI